ncbi:MAG: aminotransferase class V-fold PLP-dependent enzyme [Novosphingobium sp.]|nr:aminotransferase class V-fold PLP-dependent enzyme [Novosphingobium sp.]
MPAELIYLDHAATTPLLPEAREAMDEGFRHWANPSSPHRQGRVARAALEDARARVKAALGWDGEVIFTAGASEALAIGVARCRKKLCALSSVEHDAVLRYAGSAAMLPVDGTGRIEPEATRHDGLVAIQQVNNETGVIQPFARIASVVREAGGWLLADCAQGAGKLALPDADMIALAGHKFGGPIGIGALLLRDWAMLEASGGQEQGYRPGTENLPAVLAMAAALDAGSAWLEEAGKLRDMLEAGIAAAGGEVIAENCERIATIGAYRMPGVSSAAQLIRFDGMGIAVSAGSACSSGSLRTSHVLTAMGMAEKPASEVIRVSIGRETTGKDIARFLDGWREITGKACAAA